MSFKLLNNCSWCIIHYNIRPISSTCINYGIKNFKKFPLYHRGTKEHVQRQKENPDPDLPVIPDYMRKPGYKFGEKFVTVPEMIPELIVPDLNDCPFKPYVSYRVTNVSQSAFTPQDLFDAIYARKIVSDYDKKKLDEHGNSTEPNEEENLRSTEAYQNAKKTGSDLFSQDEPDVKPYLPGYNVLERNYGP